MTDDVSLLVMVGEGRPSTAFLRAGEVVDARIREHDGVGKPQHGSVFKRVGINGTLNS